MGAITNEKLGRYQYAADYANRMAGMNQEERSSDRLLQATNKPGVMLASVGAKGFARMLSNTAQQGSLKGIIGDTLGAGATLATLPGYGDRAKRSVDDARAQKGFIKQTADSNFGGALASNAADTVKKIGSASGGLYGASYVAPLAAQGLNYAGLGSMAKSMTAFGGMSRTAGMEAMKANPFSPTSWMAKASTAQDAAGGISAGGSTMKMNALAPWLLGKAGAGMTGAGSTASGLGLSTVGGGMQSAGGGLTSLANALTTADPIFGTTASILAMMGGGILANKFLNKMKSLHPMNKNIQSGKNITMSVMPGSQLAMEYGETKGLDGSVKMYNSTGAFSAYESHQLFYSSITAKNSGLLQYISEKIQEFMEIDRVGANLSENAARSKYENTWRDDGLTAGYREIGSDKVGFDKLGFQLNKGLSALNTGMTAVSSIMSPLNYLSMKNNPVALLNRLFEGRSETKAFENVAQRTNIPMNFLIAMETTATKAMGARGSTQERMLNLTAGLYENVRHITHMIKSKFSGKDTIGMVADEKDRLENKEAGGALNQTSDSIEKLLSYIPLLGTAAGTALKITRSALTFGSSVKGAISGGLDAVKDSKKEFSTISTMSSTELMARYIGKEFPDRFEKLLDKAHDRNTILKELAREWGVQEDKLKDTSSGTKWVQEFGKMMTSGEASGSFMEAEIASGKERAEELKSASFMAKLFRGASIKKNVSAAASRDTSKKMLSLFGGENASRSADASQANVIEERQEDAKTERSIKLLDLVASIESVVTKLKFNNQAGADADEESGPGFWSGLFGGAAVGAMAWLKKIFTAPLAMTKAGLSKVKGYARLGLLKGRGLMRGALNILGPIGKVFKPAMILAGAVELFLEWDNIVDTVKEKFGNLKNLEFGKMFGMQNADGIEVKTLGGTIKDISRTMLPLAIGLATFFPNPATIGIATALGLVAYQDDIFEGLQSAGGKFLQWFADDPEERQKKIKAKQSKKIDEAKTARNLRLINGDAAREVLSRTTRETFSSSEFSAMVKKHTGDKDSYNMHEIGNKNTEIKWIKLLNDLQLKIGKDSEDRLINSKEEFERLVQELTKNQDYKDLETRAERDNLISAINALAGTVSTGTGVQTQILQETKRNSKTVDGKLNFRLVDATGVNP